MVQISRFKFFWVQVGIVLAKLVYGAVIIALILLFFSEYNWPMMQYASWVRGGAVARQATATPFNPWDWIYALVIVTPIAALAIAWSVRQAKKVG